MRPGQADPGRICRHPQGTDEVAGREGDRSHQGQQMDSVRLSDRGHAEWDRELCMKSL